MQQSVGFECHVYWTVTEMRGTTIKVNERLERRPFSMK